MDVKQVAALMNNVTKEVLGETELVVAEDLSNIVDIGKAVMSASDVDHYVKSLVNHIGKVIFVNRPYAGGAPGVLMDGWTYGSVMEKIRAEIPEAEDNPSWTLENDVVYEQDRFHAPTVSAKFFNRKETLQVSLSTTERQVYESFSGAGQVGAFVGMLFNEVEKSMTVKMDGLIMRTIVNQMAETMYDAYPEGGYTNRGNARCVNLLAEYKARTGNTLTVARAMMDKDFLKFASYVMRMYTNRMGKISRLFNIGGKASFTPRDMLHTVYLSEFYDAASVYLESDTFHNELVRFPHAETVPFWQGSGTGYDFTDTGKISLKTASGHEVTATGILAMFFDRNAVAVCNTDRRVTTHYNAKAEFHNHWFKLDTSCINDLDENTVVFFVA